MREALLSRRIENCARTSLLNNPSVVESDDAFAEGVDFGAIVRDIKNRDLVRGVPGTQIGDDGVLEFGVEARKRFVEKQDARVGNKGTCQCDALRFAAGKLGGLARSERFEPEEFEDFSSGEVALRRLELDETVFDVLARGLMRKERGGLEKVAEMASLCRDVDAGRRVEESFITDGDATFVGSNETCNAVEECRFSGARRAEENGDAGRNGEIDVEMERAAHKTRTNGELGLG